jgi:hypothetical protein
MCVLYEAAEVARRHAAGKIDQRFYPVQGPAVNQHNVFEQSVLLLAWSVHRHCGVRSPVMRSSVRRSSRPARPARL